MTAEHRTDRVTVLAGGVGGARLAHGLDLAGTDLTVVVNVADDVEPTGCGSRPTSTP